MKRVIVRFKKDNNQKYDIILDSSFAYEEALKILQVANRKLSNKYKEKYVGIIYSYENQNQIVYVNYLRQPLLV